MLGALGMPFFDELAHLLTGGEFYGSARGDDNGNSGIFRIAADLLFALDNFKDSKIAELQTVTFRKSIGHRIQKSLDNIAHIVGMYTSILRDDLDELFLCDRRHTGVSLIYKLIVVSR